MGCRLRPFDGERRRKREGEGQTRERGFTDAEAEALLKASRTTITPRAAITAPKKADKQGRRSAGFRGLVPTQARVLLKSLSSEKLTSMSTMGHRGCESRQTPDRQRPAVTGTCPFILS
jgi:hypothetical protein